MAEKSQVLSENESLWLASRAPKLTIVCQCIHNYTTNSVPKLIERELEDVRILKQ